MIPLPRADLYSETMKGVYTNMVVLKAGDQYVYLNDCGTSVAFQGHTYLACAFSVSEPDKSDTEESSGTLTIAGVPIDYAAMLKQATSITVSVSLVKTIVSGSAVIVEGDDYIVSPTEYTVKSSTMDSASATLTLSLNTGGALGYLASRYLFDNRAFPGLNG